jgi:hypothetical protein
MCELAFQDAAGRSSAARCPSADGHGETNASGRPNSNPHPPPRVVVSDAEYRSWEAAVEQARAKTNLDRCQYVIYALKRAISCRHLSSLTLKRLLVLGHRIDPAQIAVGTASLVHYLQGQHPDVEFHFCLGEDSFWDVVSGKWKESERVLDAFRNQLWVVRRIASNDERTTAVPGLVEAAGVGARILRVPNMTSVSSSRVRACRNVEELKTLVAAPVLRYMEANGLYSFATGMP